MTESGSLWELTRVSYAVQFPSLGRLNLFEDTANPGAARIPQTVQEGSCTRPLLRSQITEAQILRISLTGESGPWLGRQTANHKVLGQAQGRTHPLPWPLQRPLGLELRSWSARR